MTIQPIPLYNYNIMDLTLLSQIIILPRNTESCYFKVYALGFGVRYYASLTSSKRTGNTR